MITKLIDKQSIVYTLLNSIENDNKISVFGCSSGEKLTLLNECGKFILFVCNSEKECYDYKEKFENINLRCEILSEGDNYLTLFNNNLQTLNTLYKIVNKEIDVLIITPNILVKNLPTINYVKNNEINIKVNDTLDVTDLVQNLVAMGYVKNTVASEVGEFVVKGDVLDIYLPQEQYVRIMFEYDKVDTIRFCNFNTLLPYKNTDEVNIFTQNYLDVNENVFLNYVEKNKNKELSNLLSSAEDKKSKLMLFAPFAKNLGGNILDYCADCVIGISDCKSVYDCLDDYVKEHNSNILTAIKDNKLTPSYKDYLCKNKIEFNNLPVVGYQYISNANRLFSPEKVFNLRTLPTVDYSNNTKLLVQDLKHYINEKYTIILYAKSNEGCNKLSKLLDENGVSSTLVNSSSVAFNNAVNIIPKNFGISSNFNDAKLFIIGTNDLFGITKKVANNIKMADYGNILPETNDIVVHNTYGIGKCLGIQCLTLSSSKRDYIVIEYKNNDKLYLPVENINSINKYVGSDKIPPLNKLGGNDFLRTKERVKGKLKEMAFDLVKLYGERQKLKGYTYPQDDELIDSFEKSFGYCETIDQITAVNDIKHDMQNGKIMDRLICGDVGFGKTEVALRGAFKTIMAGKQVAFMCPTTILSEQHYNTCLVRMKNFGVVIEVLNRFKTDKDCEKIYDRLARGEVDLVVGTHKLLNQNVKFKNLGLLILDEEQKFGVEAKEKIKNIKKNVNVLTLSATPIPRTLHMSLIGIRDISVIETPPVSRIPTIVQVVEYNDMLLKACVLKEVSRGGQVLVIYNRVETIYDFANRVRKILGDEIVVDVTHGQMPERQLEDGIFKLYNGETQVLISTTLIENGIDLPNANTLFVVNADLLGLSQLYQLKGRIGRSDRQAYAYFTYNASKLLTENASKRLEAITQFTSMGSGYKISLRDLEIRGAGNVLGVEQHGHLVKVGYSMYVELLNEAVSEIKGEKVASHYQDVRIETPLNAYIPQDYIADYNNRINTYLRISKLQTVEELAKLLVELKEIFGTIPQEVVYLCRIALIKNLANKITCEKVVLKEKQCAICFDNINKLSGANIQKALKAFADYAVLDLENLPIIYLSSKGDYIDSFDLVTNFLQFSIN